jgi:hypothetical protein
MFSLSHCSTYIKDARNKSKVTFNIRVPQFVTTILKSGYKFLARSPNLFALSREFVCQGLCFQKQWRAATQLKGPDNVHIYPSPLCLPILPSLFHICPSKTSLGLSGFCHVLKNNSIQFHCTWEFALKFRFKCHCSMENLNQTRL